MERLRALVLAFLSALSCGGCLGRPTPLSPENYEQLLASDRVEWTFRGNHSDQLQGAGNSNARGGPATVWDIDTNPKVSVHPEPSDARLACFFVISQPLIGPHKGNSPHQNATAWLVRTSSPMRSRDEKESALRKLQAGDHTFAEEVLTGAGSVVFIGYAEGCVLVALDFQFVRRNPATNVSPSQADAGQLREETITLSGQLLARSQRWYINWVPI